MLLSLFLLWLLLLADLWFHLIVPALADSFSAPIEQAGAVLVGLACFGLGARIWRARTAGPGWRRKGSIGVAIMWCAVIVWAMGGRYGAEPVLALVYGLFGVFLGAAVQRRCDAFNEPRP